jgi:hypothetical protein
LAFEELFCSKDGPRRFPPTCSFKFFADLQMSWPPVASRRIIAARREACE